MDKIEQAAIMCKVTHYAKIRRLINNRHELNKMWVPQLIENFNLIVELSQQFLSYNRIENLLYSNCSASETSSENDAEPSLWYFLSKL